MINTKKIEEKWQTKWKDSKLFESNPSELPKFFCTFPYPYINGYPHIGHFYTMMRVEAFARYKRLRGYNVLFPQGWHATGSPIVLAAKRVKENEPKQIKILLDMGIPEKEIPKFSDPNHWIEFFMPVFKNNLSSLGLSIDWRREFVTTSRNPHYDKFIQWQFDVLKEKGFVVKGKFPVVWDPKENIAIGDHDRIEGEGETTQEFCLFKFKLSTGEYVVTATLRPDTVMGITNVYVHPDITYKIIEVHKEKWIVASPVIEKLERQEFEPKIISEIKGTDLIGKKANTVMDEEIFILPATFIDENYGTGLVHSVPSDSADDLIALQDLQKDEKLFAKYGLPEEVKNIKPISIFDTPEAGDIAAQYFLDKYDVKNQSERSKLEKIKKELYKLTFNQSTYNSKYEKGFSKNLKGTLVKNGQELIKRELLEKGGIHMFYELTGKVVSRSLTNCVVKIVNDQWFIDYANPQWKELAHKCLDKMNLYPEKSRQQFNYVIDWLHEWACTREEGLGTKLPWDHKWLIESLSDSTIYKAYYTIAHKIKNIDTTSINNNFFDYVFLGKDVPLLIDKKLADELREEFNYWFPCDFRNSGKDLIQNHLTFYIFNNVAIFPEDKWPKGIGVNGWVTVDGQKMSKSLGNMIPLHEMVKKFGVDASRFTILSGGESLDDPNWDTVLAKSINNKFITLLEFVQTWYGKGREDIQSIDKWVVSQLNRIIKQTTNFMDETLFRSALQKVFFEIPLTIRWYLRRTNNNPNKEIMKKIIESQLIMLAPFIPHLCEEIWELIGKKDFIASATWPRYDESRIDLDSGTSEELIQTVIEDARQVLKLAKIEQPKKLIFITSPEWKYALYNIVKEQLKTTRNPKDIIGAVMSTELKRYAKDVMKMIPKLINGVPEHILNAKKEYDFLLEAQEFLSNELQLEVEITNASDHPKAKQASPHKPAILVE